MSRSLALFALAIAFAACADGPKATPSAPGTTATTKWAAPAQHPIPVEASSAASSTAPSPTAVVPAATGDAGGTCAPQPGGRDFTVGPGQKYAKLGDVPFETLRAGDTVRVYWREEPYREKLMITGVGTERAPIKICGIPGPDGKLPVIDGQHATTRKELDFPFDGHQVRGLVIIGHPHSNYDQTPTWIVFQGFEVRNGAPPYGFIDKAGQTKQYSGIVAGIFVERANHLTIRGCTITANNNGLFTASSDEDRTVSKNILVEGNYIYGNGSVEDYYEHNVYNEGSNVTYQFNRFGPPRPNKNGDVLGANIKERSAGVVIRYNWIEDGAHILDIVDAQEAKSVTRPMPSFHSTYVYGNVIIRGTTTSGSMIHYGGDSGVFADYRKGTLFFYDNTVFIRNGHYKPYGTTAIFEIATNDEHLESRNNVYASEIAPDDSRLIGFLGSRDRISSGIATFSGDWIGRGWTVHDFKKEHKVEDRSKITGFDKAVRGDTPGFRDVKADDFVIPVAPAVTPVPLAPQIPSELFPTQQYVKHQKGKPRATPLGIGAFGKD